MLIKGVSKAQRLALHHSTPLFLGGYYTMALHQSIQLLALLVLYQSIQLPALLVLYQSIWLLALLSIYMLIKGVLKVQRLASRHLTLSLWVATSPASLIPFCTAASPTSFIPIYTLFQFKRYY